MEILHDFVKILDDVKEVVIALTSTITITIICVEIIKEKTRPKK